MFINILIFVQVKGVTGEMFFLSNYYIKGKTLRLFLNDSEDLKTVTYLIFL